MCVKESYDLLYESDTMSLVISRFERQLKTWTERGDGDGSGDYQVGRQKKPKPISSPKHTH